MPTLSAILIVKNEANDIRCCLESLNFVDEIIILDSGSTDGTLDICRNYTPHIFSTDWPGFGRQKNRALEKAQSDWVLSIDADEYVTPALRDEILLLMAHQPSYKGYQISRLTYYCGTLIHHGDWRNDRPLRLFQRDAARFSDDDVHESVQIKDPVSCLKNNLAHNPFKDLDELINKMNLYSTLWANERYQRGERASLFTAIWHSLWTFFRGYFLFAGFLDGKAGFMLAVSNAQGCYFRYLKLMQKNQRK